MHPVRDLRPLEWDDVPGPIEFVPLILKFMLRGHTRGGEIQDEIRLEKGRTLRLTSGRGKERGKPDDSPSNKFQNSFDWAIGNYMQNELKIIVKTSSDSTTVSGMKTYSLLPRAYEYIKEQGWDLLLSPVGPGKASAGRPARRGGPESPTTSA